ncbi:hypothetical protein J2046_000236 [Rhizobium petrolearium]|uniref:SAM-dependent methyltransferase n=1 Tax=Neorhizobium petrolearium TaxID=515361 RepID=UPI001AE53097|nr:SAM-dependent methyltransferase [Neorhizobium petrolearium]MBP1841992.1 hypothetical protein [Neorhizobium petrolearium]
MGYHVPKPFTVPGPRALAIVRSAVEAGSFDDGKKQPDRTAATKCNAYGYLDRDRKQASLWFPTEKARQMLAWLESQLQDGPAVAPSVPAVSADHALDERFDASGLVATVERARALLDEGDVIRARIVAAGAYAQAKTEAAFAEKFGATEALCAKARRLQGDALLIETRAKMAIASEWDAAQAAGLVSRGGRPKAVSDGNGLTHEDTGLSRKEILEARRLADAERGAPGIVERAIAARLAAGLEPSKANLRAAVGTASATKEERGNNLYQTPPEAMHTLLALEQFKLWVLEPACGKGAISRHLEAEGFGVILSDLVDYGTADQEGVVQDVCDFLLTERNEAEPDIITNPPYGEVLNAFVAHALKVHRPQKMALLLNLNFLAGFDDPDRNFAMDENPPARIHVFKRRLPMMHREGWDGNEASSRMNTAWFVWELQPDGTYGGQTVISRVDWKDYLPADAAESEAA